MNDTSNKPLEWTRHHLLCCATPRSLPATQGQRSAECRSASDEPAADAAAVCDGGLCGMPADGAVEAIAKQAHRWRLKTVSDGLAQPKRSGHPGD